MTLVFKNNVQMPKHSAGGFDHGDVHPSSGRVFVAHTANGTVDVIDGPNLRLERTLEGCAEGSGVLCASNAREFVFAAARGEVIWWYSIRSHASSSDSSAVAAVLGALAFPRGRPPTRRLRIA